MTRELDIANESSKDTGLALKRIFSGLFGNTMLMIHALASHYVFFPDFFCADASLLGAHDHHLTSRQRIFSFHGNCERSDRGLEIPRKRSLAILFQLRRYP